MPRTKGRIVLKNASLRVSKRVNPSWKERPREKGAVKTMAIAHVLINCDMGFEGPIIEELKQIQGVTEARGVFGSYDIVVRLECPTRELVREIVSRKIRKTPHVRTTLTLLDIEM